VLSVGIFFTLLIVGLASSLPAALSGGLEAHGVSHAVGPRRALPAHAHAALTGQAFFPHLIAGPFSDGLDTAFTFAIVACLVAAAASLLRGGQYHHAEEPARAQGAPGQIPQLEESHAS
jgi:hypothetical protein